MGLSASDSPQETTVFIPVGPAKDTVFEVSEILGFRSVIVLSFLVIKMGII